MNCEQQILAVAAFSAEQMTLCVRAEVEAAQRLLQCCEHSKEDYAIALDILKGVVHRIKRARDRGIADIGAREG